MNTMNPEIVRQKLQAIKEDAQQVSGETRDLETALHYAVLSAIAEGTCENPQECAKLALSSSEIDFPRW